MFCHSQARQNRCWLVMNRSVVPSILTYKLSPNANCIDPDLPSPNDPADLGLCSLLEVISRINNIDPDLQGHYAKVDQDLCCLQFDL